MKMVCKQCQTSLKPFENSVTVIVTAGDPPYPTQIWEADIWECPECGVKIVIDFGLGPIAMRGDKDFFETLGKIKAGDGMIVYDNQMPEDVVLKDQDMEIDSPRLIDVIQQSGL